MSEIVDEQAGLAHVRGLLADAGGRTVVLTGAGMSTESGIPDYRGPTGRARPATPMTYQEFTTSDTARQRYWARSHIGWRRIARAQPNAGHRALARLQRHGDVAGIITQNVDGLHQGAGARDVVELHGSLDRVVCLECGDLTAREHLEVRLDELNPAVAQMFSGADLAVKPDGDVDIAHDVVRRFVVAACERCGGQLKPDVVFFGESVPPERVAECFARVDDAAAVLVLGSSLAVMSGYRFVRRAHRAGIPVVIVNQGATRGDGEAVLRVDAPLGRFLEVLSPGWEPQENSLTVPPVSR